MAGLLVLGLLLLSGPGSRAASPEEDAAFNAAARAFNGGNFARAEREFARFIEQFPDSTRFNEALLSQVQSRFRLQFFDGVIELVKDRLDTPDYGPRFRYWQAEAQMQKGDYLAASGSFGKLMTDHPGSPRALEAGYGLAMAHLKLNQPEKTVTVLQPADGAFQQAARTAKDTRLVRQGALLLGEALLVLNRDQAALAHLAGLNVEGWPDDLAWQREHLLARSEFELGRLPAARSTAERSVTLAGQTGNASWLADSNQLLARVLERLPDIPAAIAIHERNLAPAVPVEHRREALLRIIDLELTAGKTTETLQRLDQFIKQHPEDPVVDLAHLTMGELFLRDYYAKWSGSLTNDNALLAGTATNLLVQAQLHLDHVITAFPDGKHFGKALLDRGWCHWGAGRIEAGRDDFEAAVGKLPPSADQVVARFKWADAQFRLGNFPGALTNYQQVALTATNTAGVDPDLAHQALYQVVQAATAAGELGPAEAALNVLLTGAADSLYAQPSLMLVGEAANASGQSEQARQIFARFFERFPGAQRAPEVNLAIARTYVQERNWPAALKTYQEWTAKFADHPAAPQAMFSLGWTSYLAGQETNSLTVFTNFLAQFPAHPLGPLAQTWVADHYFSRGAEDVGFLVKAEEGYLRVFQNTNWPANELSYQARVSAARAAVARQGYNEARGYLTNLINDVKAPSNLVAQAFIALGDVILDDPAPTASPADRWAQALEAFRYVPRRFPGTSVESLALGRIADCHLQLAATDPAQYSLAAEHYRKAMEVPQSDLPTRCKASLGLASVAEQQARDAQPVERAQLLETAVNHSLDVFYPEKLVRPGESPDRYWVQMAGLKAARLLTDLGQLDRARHIYEELTQQFPAQKELFQRLREQLLERGKPSANSAAVGESR